MTRVLLTGASGFIGRHCVPLLLARGYEVHAATSQAPSAARGVCWHQADLLDAAQVAALLAAVQPTHLLHLAWYAVPGEYWTSPQNFRWVQASLALLEAFARQGGRRVVAAGTCAEYDWRYGLCAEDVTPLAPATPYGVCKHALQTMLASFAEQAGLSAAWGRIFFLYGAGEHPARLVASVIGALLRREPARCTHGEQVRDFLYVEDVAAAFVELLGGDVCGPVNVASGIPVRLKEIVQTIGAMVGREELIQLGVVPAPPGEPPVLLADTRRLREEVGWRPTYDLATGLAETIRWWQGQALEPTGQAESGRQVQV
jgi:nucleoside-diphosphate-sugar epimerase